MTSSTRMPPESRLVIRSSSASSISGCAFLISLRTQLSLWRTSAMAWSTGEMEACAVPHAARGQKNVDPKVAFPFSRPACLLLGRPARANPQLRASFAPDYVTAPSSPSLLLRTNVLIFWAVSTAGPTAAFAVPTERLNIRPSPSSPHFHPGYRLAGIAHSLVDCEHPRSAAGSSVGCP